MKITPLICSALVLASGISLPRLSADAATARDDKASIEALEMRFRDAVVAKDANALMQAYAPGTRLFVFDVTPPPTRGMAGLQEGLAGSAGGLSRPEQVRGF
jgi:ketosteroid isomerase-like protein